MIIHAPLQFPEGIKYKIFCSTEVPTETPEEVEQRIRTIKSKNPSLRKRLSASLRDKMKKSGISSLLTKLGIKKLKPTKKREVNETELVATLRYVLSSFIPSSEFLGFATEIESPNDEVKIVLSQSNWPKIQSKLIGAGWKEEQIILMPVAESDYWGYWKNLGLLWPDKEKIINSEQFIHHLQKNKIITNNKAPFEYRKTKGKALKGILSNTHVYPFPSDESDIISANDSTVQKIISALSDEKSKEIYKNVLFGEPEQRFELFIENLLNHQQYFEYLQIKPDDVLINVGIDNGFELPFLCAHMQGKGMIYNLDPFGFKYCSPYVARTIPYFKDILKEVPAIVCDVTGPKAPPSPFGDLGDAPATTIDDFVKKEQLTRVDLIKMDIEAMEEQAVPHLLQTVKQFRPQLAIAVYHRTPHFWELPNLIIDACESYDFYFNIYSSTHFEGIFYAIPKEEIKGA